MNMAPAHEFDSTLETFETASGRQRRMYSLPALARQFPNVARLPVSLRIVLESMLRHCDGNKVTAAHVEALAGWLAKTGYLAERGEGAGEIVRASAPLVKRKISTFADYDALAGWLFTPLEIEPEAWEVLTRDVKHSIQVIGGGLGRLESLPEFTVEAVKDALQDQLHVMGEAARDFLEPQRIAVTGRPVSTGVYESIWLAGRDTAVERYRGALARLAEEWQSSQ